MRGIALAFGLVLTLLGIVALAPHRPADTKPAPLKVVVTIAPLKGLVEPLLPEGSSVKVLMQPGKSEHGYEFTPADLAAVANADLVVYVGLGLDAKVEAARKKQGLQPWRSICFADVVGVKAAAEHDGEDTDDHDSKGGHDHHEHGPGYVDPHLWLDPVLVEKLVPVLESSVHNAVEVSTTGGRGVGVDLEALHKESLRADAAAKDLCDRIRAVDKEWTDRLAPLKGRSVVTHHNAFSRPAARYGFKVAAVIREFETSDPSPGDIARVVEAIRKENVKTIFVEPQFNAAAAERIASTAGVRIGHLDPLGAGDWFKLMKTNLDALVNGLSDEQAPRPGAAGAK
jgi:zinc transport system substrate-binding protein